MPRTFIQDNIISDIVAGRIIGWYDKVFHETDHYTSQPRFNGAVDLVTERSTGYEKMREKLQPDEKIVGVNVHGYILSGEWIYEDTAYIIESDTDLGICLSHNVNDDSTTFYAVPNSVIVTWSSTQRNVRPAEWYK